MTTQPRPQQLTLTLTVVDIAAARRYLRDLRALCDEAIRTRDERVLSLALAVVADQRRTVAQLRRVVEFFE